VLGSKIGRIKMPTHCVIEKSAESKPEARKNSQIQYEIIVVISIKTARTPN